MSICSFVFEQWTHYIILYDSFIIYLGQKHEAQFMFDTKRMTENPIFIYFWYFLHISLFNRNDAAWIGVAVPGHH